MSGCFDYRVTRRTMLGAAGASFLGFQVRDLLANVGADHAAKAEHVILFWNGGGMSHLDTWDPKPGQPTQGEFDPIETSAPGIQISEIFPELARQMHHCALIRSVAGTQGAHGRATYNLQTSYNESANLIHPGFGSVVVHELEKQGDLPPYVTISGRAPRASYLGQMCEAYYVGAPGEQDPYLAFPEGIGQVRGDKRLETLSRFNNRFAAGKSDERLAAAKTSVEDAVRLMRSPALEAFELDKVPTTTINRYGDTTFGRGCLLAKQLVETGVRFVQVNRGGFDTHSNNFPAMRGHGEVMDPALAALIEDLADSGMLEKTLVVMLSEFGRTPTINPDAGRDHYPQVFSAFLAGGGIRGGTVIGSSDAEGRQVEDRPVQVADLHATFCHTLGIDPNREVITPLQRPMKLVDNGEPVMELFG
ncbi:MAG: DUF1501 domain-containing protein [Planctomycetota bacterium]|mgnify:CR=1 FL=1|nr:MAG: DUF1501 domain-containing protein [Planctomycetota bacterium]REJ91526.1 MAG: DUF1501 domain-containing protein [Planctomycetota bacterium]REK20541.1 MAG: DUF1501 domain-containing protein [Planctomycetota bacterium]REK28295.1 MAG: DUF1501 domain-containing protein [Planctomycetota bacterium]